MKRVAAAMLFILMGVGCAMGVEPAQGEGTGIDQQALEPGCHVVCPNCKSGDVCAMVMCYVECNGVGQKCGAVTCGPSKVCCNESCGICTEKGGVCSQEICTPATY